MSGSGRVIKLSEMAGQAAVPFNPSDIVKDLEARYARAHEELAAYQREVAEKARKVTEEAHRSGFQAGYAEGLTRGEADIRAKENARIEADIQSRMQALAPALKSLLGDLDRQRDMWIAAWEQKVLRIACGIAGRVVRRELAIDDAVISRTIRELVPLVGRCPSVRLHLHPADADTLAREKGVLEQLRQTVGRVDLVPDPALERGGCRLETESGQLDAEIETQLRRIEEELAGPRDPQ
jgi:flagellar biosynthesis/type III secretory pathway protein FliH